MAVGGAEAGAELRVGRERPVPHGDLRPEHLVETPLQVGQAGIVHAVRHVATDHLPPGVHPGVRTARPDQRHRHLQDTLHRGPQVAHHGANTFVLGEPVEAGTVVGDGEAEAAAHRRQPTASVPADGVAAAASRASASAAHAVA